MSGVVDIRQVEDDGQIAGVVGWMRFSATGVPVPDALRGAVRVGPANHDRMFVRADVRPHDGFHQGKQASGPHGKVEFGIGQQDVERLVFTVRVTTPQRWTGFEITINDVIDRADLFCCECPENDDVPILGEKLQLLRTHLTSPLVARRM